MGDLTSVCLCVPRELEKQTREIIRADNPEEEEGILSNGLAYWVFHDVNYGELESLPALRKAGIAYSSDWEAGNEYTKGSEHCRFTESGECVVITVYAEERGVDFDLLDKALQKEDPLAAVKSIIETHRKTFVPLPWANQVEYGKRYRTLQLIQPETK